MLLFILRCSLSTGRNVLRFNTSHVVIYLYNHAYFLVCKKFQYISCCYLSIQRPAVTPARIAFQYISCCYLSLILWRTRTMRKVFQYISCCYLSDGKQVKLSVQQSFNTSHVVIYRKRKNLSLIRLFCFNTSHVVIYQSLATHYFVFFTVSIHLMLLFIEYEQYVH